MTAQSNFGAPLREQIVHLLRHKLEEYIWNQFSTQMGNQPWGGLWEWFHGPFQGHTENRILGQIDQRIGDQFDRWQALGLNLVSDLKWKLQDHLWEGQLSRLPDPLRDQIMTMLGRVGSLFRDQARVKIENTFEDHLDGRIGMLLPLGDQIRVRLKIQIGILFSSQFEVELWRHVRERLTFQLQDQLWSPVANHLENQLGGQL